MRGIDYGMGKTNIDTKTGIRYGVIGTNALPYIWDDLEPEYGNPECPDCGAVVDDTDKGKCSCGCTWNDPSDCYSEEPLYWYYDGTDWVGCTYQDGSVLMVVWSKHTIKCQFCSPCYPGAGDLDSPCDDGVETYTLPPEYFEGE